MFTNLLNNAAKYTEPGGRIQLTAMKANDEAVIRIRDNGVGIPPEMLDSIFDLFVQADRSLDRSNGGLGIGLTLVHRLVELHGGTVQARSEGPGRGSEFEVRLPITNVVPIEPRPAARKPILENRLQVLVVDDNIDGAESLAMLLRLAGHEVKVAHTGASALETAVTDPPDVAVLDIGLPGMDGYSLARLALRSRPGNSRIPFSWPSRVTAARRTASFRGMPAWIIISSSHCSSMFCNGCWPT